MTATVLQDRHARAHSVEVLRVDQPETEDQLQQSLDTSAKGDMRLSVGGRRHAMGGQQFASGSVHLDMSHYRGVVRLNPEGGTVTVRAGTCWPQLIGELLELQAGKSLDEQFGIRQKQTGANDLTIGGAIAANAHGRGLTMKPMIGDIEKFRLLRPNQEPVDCSRYLNTELFCETVGGYGLTGVVSEVELKLSRRKKVRRIVDEAQSEDLLDRFQERVNDGYLYGDFQFDIDPRSPRFLRRGVFSCYQPVGDSTPIPADQKYFTPEIWLKLVRLARADKARAYREYVEHYQSTDGQVYFTDTHQLSTYVADYPDVVNPLLPQELRGTEMITELYVARHRLPEFLEAAAKVLADRNAPVVYGTVRLAEPDDESHLAWSHRYRDGNGAECGPACVIFNLLWSPETAAERAEDFRCLIDLAIGMGDSKTSGSFFLTYHRFARPDQLREAYPRLEGYLRCRAADGSGICSDWADSLLRSFRGE